MESPLVLEMQASPPPTMSPPRMPSEPVTAKSVASLIAGSVALCVVLSGCGPGGGGPPPEPAIEVTISQPVLSMVEDLVSAVGTIEANERVELKPKAAGLIESIHFVEGDRVVAGQKLFSLDARKEAAAVAQAEAEVSLSRSNLERAKQLIGTRAISQQEVEQLESQVAVREAIARLEKERLADREILAPFAGVVGPRLVSPGQYVNVGTPLVVLVDGRQVKVGFRIPERQLGLVRVGQPGRLRVNAFPDRVFGGKLDLVDPEVDATTRTVAVRLIAPNPEGLLRPGMFARVELVVSQRERAVVIPEAAVVPSLDTYSVYLVKDGRARMQSIKLGTRLPGKVEVLEGLSQGQDIVVSGLQKVIDGAKVVAAKPETAGGPAGGGASAPAVN